MYLENFINKELFISSMIKLVDHIINKKFFRRFTLPIALAATLSSPIKSIAGDPGLTVFGKAGYFVPSGPELSEVYGAGPSFSGGLGISGYYGSLVFGIDYFKKVGDWYSSWEEGLFSRRDSYSEGNVRIISPSATAIFNLRGKDKNKAYITIGGGASAVNIQEELFYEENASGFVYDSGASLSDKISKSGYGFHGVLGVRQPLGSDRDYYVSGEVKYDHAEVDGLEIGGITLNFVVGGDF